MASLPDQCCDIPPFKSNYTPIGKRVMLDVEGRNPIEVYLTGPSDGTRAIIGLYGMRLELWLGLLAHSL
jgi:hypothetical protein